MGNSASAVHVHQQQSVPYSTRDAAVGLPSGREREQAAATAAATDGRPMAAARFVAPQSAPQQRIVVDIRSAQLDKDYNVYIRQEPRRELEVELRSVWNGLQALGGLCITVLTIQKLWEDIRFIRLLRRELSTIVGSLTDTGSGTEAGNGEGTGTSRPIRPRPAGGAPTAATARQLDLHLNELSDLLGGGRAGSGGQQLLPTADPGGPAGGQKDMTWASISGLMEVKILLQEATVLPTLRPDLFKGIRQPPKALLLFGPPGTGKTLLARAVAAESRATFLPVTGSSVLSMWYGQSEQNVKALFEKARRKQPSIIFIDEVDSLLGKRSAGGVRDSTPDKRVTNEFLAFIDGIQTQTQQAEGGSDARVVVIAATNTPWDLDEAALSRFSRRIYVPLPDKTTRQALMRKAMEGVACNVSEPEWLRLAERSDKYSGRDLVQVCREAAMRPLRELWGRRLLDGSATSPTGEEAGTAPRHAAAQQQLVDLVANSLAAGAADKSRVAAAAEAATSGGRVGVQAAAGAARSGWGSRWRWRWAGGGGDRFARSKKQARRELERWKRRHGATWCDVEAVMQQAERLAEIRRQGAAAEAQEVGQAAAQGRSEGPQEQQHSQHQQAGNGHDSGQQGRRGQQRVRPAVHLKVGSKRGTAASPGSGDGPEGQQLEHQQHQQPDVAIDAAIDAASGTPATPAVEEEVELSVSSTSVPAVPEAKASSRAAAAGAGAGEVEVAGSMSPNTGAEAEVGVDTATSATTAAATAQGTAVGLMTDLHAATGGSGSEGAAAARGCSAGPSSPRARVDAPAASPEGPTPVCSEAVTTSAAGSAAPAAATPAAAPAAATTAATPAAATCAATPAAATTAAAPAAATPAADPDAATPAADPAAATPAAAPAAATPAAGSPALSLEDLLALPATRVRPVVVADLDSALQVISCTEMDQTARYTEWDEQYGSGANASGRMGGGRVGWMSMYV